MSLNVQLLFVYVTDCITLNTEVIYAKLKKYAIQNKMRHSSTV